MNRINLALLLLLSFITLRTNAQELAADTVANIHNPSEVIITDNGESTTVTVNGTARRPDYHFVYSVKSDTTSNFGPSISLPFVDTKLSHAATRSVTFFSDLYMGAVLPYHAPDPVRTSLEAGIGNLIGYRYNYSGGASLGVGFGIGSKHLKIRRGAETAMEGDRFILLPAPAGAVDVHTNLTCFNLQLPLYYRQRIHRSLAFKFAVVLNYNVTARAKTTYTLEGVNYTHKVKGLHQRLLTPDFTFTFGTLDFGGVYVRWSPVKMFKSAYGPGISTLSLGFSLAF